MEERVYTDQAPAAIGPYSQAVKANGFLFTSGQIPINPVTGRIESQDIAGQATQACENVGAILNAAGTDFTRVIKTTCFLKKMSDFSVFNSVYAEYFVTKPARSCVAVLELPKDALCEIEVVAVLREGEDQC